MALKDYNFDNADFLYAMTLCIIAFLVVFFIVVVSVYSSNIEDQSKECQEKGGYYIQTGNHYHNCVDRKLIIQMESK